MKKKVFSRLSAAVLLFLLGNLWRLAGAFLTWWSAAKKGRAEKGK